LLAKDNKFHSQTKHINLRYHFICEAVEEEKIKVTYIPTEDNIADQVLGETKICAVCQNAGVEGVRERVNPV